jgi:hypothetical protein
MALDNIPTLGPGGFNGNLDKVLVHKNGGSEVACSLLTLTNSALNPAGLYLDPVNQRVGINTPNPATTLQVNGVTALSNADLTGYPLYSVFNIVRNGATSMAMDRYTGAPHFNFRAAGGTIASPSTQVGELGNIGWWSHSGTAFNRNVLIIARVENFVGGLAQIQRLSIGMGQNGGGTDYYYEMVNGNSYFGADAYGSTPTARVQIKGSGSTSATTSLLVQNSSGTQLMRVYDDGNVNIGSVNGAVSFNLGYNNFFAENRLHFYSAATNIRGMNAGNQGLIISKNSGTADLYPTALLAIDSTTQGFLKPRMTTAQKNLIASPAAGLEVYDTDLNRPCFFNGTSWITL